MSIDSREKRQSIVGINYLSGPSPTPNASPDQEWRQEVGYGYPGILADDPTPVTFEPVWAMNSNTLIGGGFTHV